MTETENLNIYQKLAKIRKTVEIIKKNKKGYGYTYVTEDEILAKVTAGMEKQQVSLIPNILHNTMTVTPVHYEKTKTLKDGSVYDEHVNEVLIQAEMEYVWVNNENPEEVINVPWIFVGQQGDVSQAFGSGLTYAGRYFLLKYFNVSTSDDDPDNWRSKQAEAAQQEDKIVIAQIVEQIDMLVQQNKTDENREKILDLVKSVVRKGGKPSPNYFEIDSLEVAKRLLSDLKKLFGIDTNIKEKKSNKIKQEEINA